MLGCTYDGVQRGVLGCTYERCVERCVQRGVLGCTYDDVYTCITGVHRCVHTAIKMYTRGVLTSTV